MGTPPEPQPASGPGPAAGGPAPPPTPAPASPPAAATTPPTPASAGPPAATPIYPLSLRLEGRLALVVGGGSVALRRVAGLREAGAEIVVVAPRLTPALAD